MELQKIVVCGVPEHFNLPWHLAIENGLFAKHGVLVEFVEQKLGTGAMITSAKSGEVDVILALTEGLVADIANGSDLRLFGTYVQSPLCWAISTGQASAFNAVEDLKGQTFGISRNGSGSQLMVYVLAMERGWHPQRDVNFAIKGDFKSLRDGVNDNSTAAFLWETFTTKPFHDSGEIRRIGDITSPWPCFMMAGRKDILDRKKDAIQKMLAAIRESCRLFHSDQGIVELIAKRYDLKVEDAQQWYSNVQIVGSTNISESAIKKAVEVLYRARVLSSVDHPAQKFIYEGIASLRKDIKLVRLYNKPELLRALFNNLHAANLASGPISYEDLLPYDQHHYHEVEGLEVCIKEAHLGTDSRILNVGSGLGGPARYFGGKLGASVLAVELQDDLHRTAAELTARCGLNDNVHHLAGDILQVGQHLRPDSYDAIVSWLTVLHIPERAQLFKTCYSLLKPGGVFYAEDFFEKATLTEEEKRRLADDVYCPYLPNEETYKRDLVQAGFEIVTFEDLTEDWRQYTTQRVAKWDADHDRLVQVHREDTFNRLRYFYNIVRELYAGGHLGGARILARKPISA